MPDGMEPCAAARTDAPAGAGAGACSLVERQVEALGELVGIGLKIARAIERQVDAAGAGPQAMADLNAAAIAFARVARAVRQSVMLQSRLQQERTAAAARAGELKARVARIVRRAIEDEHGETEQVERLAAEAAERLEQERYGDVFTRPLGEIVADICRDLGLAPDWRGLAAEIAAAEAFARGAPDAAAAEEESGPIEVYWLDDDGRPTPAPIHRYASGSGAERPCDPAEDARRRRDTS